MVLGKKHGTSYLPYTITHQVRIEYWPQIMNECLNKMISLKNVVLQM